MSGHYYFVEKLRIVEKNLCKRNCVYGKVSHTLNKGSLLFESLIFLEFRRVKVLLYFKNFQ